GEYYSMKTDAFSKKIKFYFNFISISIYFILTFCLVNYYKLEFIDFLINTIIILILLLIINSTIKVTLSNNNLKASSLFRSVKIFKNDIISIETIEKELVVPQNI